jgi:predicted HAD superfamily phosphohydrolase YqeG
MYTYFLKKSKEKSQEIINLYKKLEEKDSKVYLINNIKKRKMNLIKFFFWFNFS